MRKVARMLPAAGLLLAVAAGGVTAWAQQQPDRPSRPGQPPVPPPSQRQPLNDPMSKPMSQPMQSGGSKTLLQRGSGAAPKVSDEELTRAVQGWDKKHIEALKKLTDKYGMPSSAGPDVVVWKDNSPFVQTTVYSGSLDHHFPVKHVDFLEQAISYEVPADKFDDLAEFDGSIIVDRTRGTIAARCDKEENNLLALNLAHEVITGKKEAKEARDAFAKIALAAMKGQKDPLMQKLQFEPKPMALGFTDEVHPEAAAAGILAAPEEPPMPEDMPERKLDKPDKDDLDKPLPPRNPPQPPR